MNEDQNNNVNNPLNSYFRKPVIHMALPSKGKFYTPGSINIPPTGELPVYPMTALDEISYKTPDALFNGSAVVDVIKSCIPSIIDPWQIPQIDLSTILSNIRLASFGEELEIETVCPKCSEESTYSVDLRDVNDHLQFPDYNKGLSAGDLTVYFKPLTYKQVNDGGRLSFEEQQLSKAIIDSDLDEDEKIKRMTAAFKNISNYTIETLGDSINLIKTPGADVTEREYIIDYLQHCDRSIFNRIKERIIADRGISDIKPLKITCDNKECKHTYTQPFTIDPSHFFD